MDRYLSCIYVESGSGARVERRPEQPATQAQGQHLSITLLPSFNSTHRYGFIHSQAKPKNLHASGHFELVVCNGKVAGTMNEPKQGEFPLTTG